LALVARLLAAEVDSELLGALRESPFARCLALDLEPRDELEQLAVEYCRLFVMPDAPCPPYLGAIRQEPLLGGRAAAALALELEAEGFESIAPIYGDHVATYLELASILEPGPRRRLLATHRAWLTHYFSKLEASASVGLYQLTAQLALALVEEAAGRLDLSSA
jgi:TorA maturation chaperone TorD